MKGYTKLLGMFIKIINIAFLVLVLFGVFISITDFKIDVVLTEQDKALRLVGEAALSSDCLAATDVDGQPIKGLLNMTKLNAEAAKVQNRPSCMVYPCPVLLLVGKTPIEIGDKTIKGRPNSTWPAALLQDGKAVPTTVTVVVDYNEGCAGKCG